ncbi:hypothetical protein POSPLADRAFT_1139991 [Postia placenta MAD-698-R-SB12]|uniref:R3H domain-containing protein n=1 Tax=Postia placenta MAD-698-R-SB12 TaxID=670580 RepID=A0A1X6N4C7_9APHY|nr:hypothetical protein POSPLADRAFT_1139991 [Postia placenta MAD-698-R-SB12]OSX63454.1 hypothetical protein POSPLADRAFT_1139991 [Postia placenta MAD-698-R-SB12]
MTEALSSSAGTHTAGQAPTLASHTETVRSSGSDTGRRWRRKPRTTEQEQERDRPPRYVTSDSNNAAEGPSKRPPRRKHPNRAPDEGSSPRGSSLKPRDSSAQPSTTDKQVSPQNSAPKKTRRGKFNSALTESEVASHSTPSEVDVEPSKKFKSKLPEADDLTSRLIRELCTPPFPDCIICFAPIRPAQPTWSCSPASPVLFPSSDDSDNERARATDTAQCCWTTFHLKCIKQWAVKSVKDIVEAWRARGEDRVGDWRCPGCQSKRTAVPSSYWCFCGSMPEPKPSRLATPHSCANPCSRPRACGHSCPLACHPGPCPPCQVTTELPCHCGKETLSFKCAKLAPSRAQNSAAAELSCGSACGRQLSCGNHRCEDVCHPGPCPPCKVRETGRCYCGKEERELGCGIGEEKECSVLEDGEHQQWTGRFVCEAVCGRPFDCGIHTCSKPCHPPSSTPAVCPRSPSLVTHCPCGKHALNASSAPYFQPRSVLTRTSCADPIPTCKSICMKPLEGCSHACAVRCHTGPCPPCTIALVRPCRCGATTRDVPCTEDQARGRGAAGVEEILCERRCNALRACGRHQCKRMCCPLASLTATAKGKGKKRAGADVLVDEAGWHECDLVCGKPLACGNHQCELRDHRGACPSCLRSSFEEMVCNCGRTVLQPPVPCGTRINCHYPCARPLECGHSSIQHACHEDPAPCPPCPILMSKRCSCGKKMVDNVKCSQEKVLCGTVCGKLLSCGFHHCERLCHGDACGPCTTVCGKARKLCLPAHHPCTLPCHAPATCDETEACRTTVYLTCPCGRIRQPVACGGSISNPAGREGSQQLKCSNECLVAKRNARLADALGIDPNRTGTADRQVVYNDELLAYAKANYKFCLMVEKSFADFLSSDKKNQVLAHMPESRRKFVYDLASIYRMDTQMVDQEPNRSVQLFRRIDSRTPNPLLSAGALAPRSTDVTPSPGASRLTALRGSGMQALPRSAASPAPTAGSSSAGGWRAVVTRPSQPKPAANAWGPPPSTRATSRATPSPSPSRQPQPPVASASTTTAEPREDVPENWEDDL